MAEQSQTSLTVIEPFRSELKSFSTTQDFMKYYALHKVDIDSMTTYQLNKAYAVAGYRFTRVTVPGVDGKQLRLRKAYPSDHPRPKNDALGPTRSGGPETYVSSMQRDVDTDVVTELVSRVDALEREFYSFTAHVNKYLA